MNKENMGNLSRQDHNEKTGLFHKKLTRREMIQTVTATGVGAALGMTGMGAFFSANGHTMSQTKTGEPNTGTGIVPFYGQYQAGIATPPSGSLGFCHL